jgi:MFS family permease
LIFGAWEYHLGNKALLPIHMLFNRTQVRQLFTGVTATSLTASLSKLAAGLAVFFIMATHLVNIYHLPFLFQAKGRSASQSGVDIFPYVLGMVLSSVFTGIFVRRTGRYWQFLLSGPAIAAVGSGLLFTVTPQTDSAKLIGYQIIVGFGVGNVFQVPSKIFTLALNSMVS